MTSRNAPERAAKAGATVDGVPARELPRPQGTRDDARGSGRASERRKAARRGPVRGRGNPAGSARFDAPSYFIPREWLLMAPALAAAVAIMGFTSNSMPDAFEFGMSALAVFVFAMPALLAG
ncbi:MAG TPA: hypothetical protein PKE25_09620, partial [Novosphingobium sp.]|nr:hypothetical protein [Novosphingobium sp.]